MKKIFIILGIVFITGIIFLSLLVKFISIARLPEKETTEVTKTVFPLAPDFILKDSYGAEKKLSDFKGKVIILDFWATWCPACKREIPHFIELYNEYKDKGLEIIGVAIDWNAERIVPPFVQESGINYRVLLGNQDVQDLYGGIMSIPTAFIIDKDGRIRNMHIGYTDKEVFENEIKKLL